MYKYIVADHDSGVFEFAKTYKEAVSMAKDWLKIEYDGAPDSDPVYICKIEEEISMRWFCSENVKIPTTNTKSYKEKNNEIRR
jgi:hypothetical protein